MKYLLDSEETEIQDAFSKGTLKKTSNQVAAKHVLKSTALNTIKKMENIYIQLPSHEIHQLKIKSLETGVPMDNIISALIHNYLGNKISIKL